MGKTRNGRSLTVRFPFICIFRFHLEKTVEICYNKIKYIVLRRHDLKKMGINKMKQQKQVNILKNFTDGLAFFAGFLALAFVLIAKKEFEPTEEILKFHQVESTRAYIIIACAFFASALISALSRHLPPLSAPLSIMPFYLSFFLFDNDFVPKSPMIFILLGLVHFAGCLTAVGQWFADSREYSKNTSISIACGISYAVITLAFWIISERFLKYRWRLWLVKPFYFVAVMGTACGLLGVVWYFLTPKPERKEQKLWYSVIASLLCFAVLIIRYFFDRIGL